MQVNTAILDKNEQNSSACNSFRIALRQQNYTPNLNNHVNKPIAFPNTIIQLFFLKEFLMNRKSIAVFAVLMIFFISCASTGSGSGYNLHDAIEQSAEQIAGNLPAGSRVAIVAFESEHDNISDYIMEELTGALFDRNIEVADRQNLEYVFKELDFQMSGEVSDESAKSIGKFLAADMVITGQMLNLDSVYRYRTNAINVETAVRASVTRLDVRSDNTTQRMLAAITRQQTTTKTAKYGVSADVTPQTAGTFLDRGIMFASRGDYETSIKDFTEALRLNPNMTAAYILRGRAYVGSVSLVTSIAANFGDVGTGGIRADVSAEQAARVHDLAIADFTAAIRLDPNSPSALWERGRAYLGNGSFDRAIADFNEVIRLDPNDAGAYNSRGNAYNSKGDIDRAIADFTAAIRLDPNLAFPYNNRGIAYVQKNDIDRAIADFTAAIRIDPNYALSHYNRGNAYHIKGDVDRAIADFNEAIRLAPEAGTYNNRGNAYRAKGDVDRAIADYTEAIRLAPNYVDAYYNRGRRYLDRDDLLDRAIADFTIVIRIDPNDADAYFYRGLAYAYMDDLDHAIADWESTLRLDPNNADARRNLEQARRVRGW